MTHPGISAMIVATSLPSEPYAILDAVFGPESLIDVHALNYTHGTPDRLTFVAFAGENVPLGLCRWLAVAVDEASEQEFTLCDLIGEALELPEADAYIVEATP